jgi:beta-lactamase regulating signal transducer with metallopeptidase domain
MHWIAAMALERMLYCLLEGSAVAAIVALVLRLAPKKNSRTRFAVWLSTLAAVVVLPVVPMGIARAAKAETINDVVGSSASHALLTLSSTVAECIVLAWAALAALGLMRVGVSMLQIRRLRRDCSPIAPELLGEDLRILTNGVSRRRPVSLLVSSQIEVPTAIGFFRPAVVLPAWLAETADQEELKYILLHEMAHLQRWDDWTNLAQKLVKAVLFFHPGVWWIERKLSLDREMACDDAVLAQTGAPRVYARCLARVAEKGFLRRQIMLAQAAVDRMRQLSLRVARILNSDRERSTRLWKPALPIVAIIALFCALFTVNAPRLVRVNDNPRSGGTAALAAKKPVGSGGADQVFRTATEGLSRRGGASFAGILQMANFTPVKAESPKTLQALLKKSRPNHSSLRRARFTLSQKPVSTDDGSPSPADERPTNLPGSDAQVAGSAPPMDGESPTQRYGVVLVVMTGERIASAGTVTWQVNMWELRLMAPVEHPAKPTPRKI